MHSCAQVPTAAKAQMDTEPPKSYTVHSNQKTPNRYHSTFKFAAQTSLDSGTYENSPGGDQRKIR
jgi:hypothetical protein